MLIDIIFCFNHSGTSRETGFTSRPFEAIVRLLPSSLTDLCIAPPLSLKFGIDAFARLSTLPCASKLRSLKLGNVDVPASHSAAFENFASLTYEIYIILICHMILVLLGFELPTSDFDAFLSSLDLSSSVVHLPTFTSSVMKLTRLVELKFNSNILSDEEYTKFFDALIGTLPDALTLPFLEVLTCSVSEDLLTIVLERLLQLPAAGNLRCVGFEGGLSMPFYPFPKQKELLAKFPLEKLDHALPWSEALVLLPVVPNAREITLDSVLISSNTDPDVQDDPANVNLLTTEKVEFIAQNLATLVDLHLWCPIADHTSFVSLSCLTSLRIDPDSTVPKSFKIRGQSIVFPQSLRSLTVASSYRIDGATIIPSLTPLANLTHLRWSSSAFLIDEFIDFIACLPKQLTNLHISDSLRTGKIIPPYAARTALINLPKLSELIVTDDIIAKRSVSFAFACAPRLRHLSYDGFPAQVCSLLESLLKFPWSRERTCTPLLSFLSCF
jgi:hypothetical protein